MASAPDNTGGLLGPLWQSEGDDPFRLLAENATDFIQFFALDGTLLYDSPSFVRAAGAYYVRERKSGHFIHPDDHPKLQQFTETLGREGHAQSEALRYVFGDSEQIWVHLTANVARDANGEPKMVVVVARDISEIRRNAEKLHQTQKLEAIGQLTGGLAHDFNNLLGIVLGNLDWLQEHLPNDPTVLHRLQSATKAAERGAAVTKALLAVARRQPLALDEHDLNLLIQEILPLIRTSAGAATQVSVQLTREPLPVRLDAGGLSSALLNLVINAREAMLDNTGPRTLGLRTRLHTYNESNRSGVRAGSYALLEVSDNGCGMSETVRTQAFDPFFTTRERGHGTGLGLSTVQGFAHQLGGTVEIDSSPGQGTTVRLSLPLSKQA
jgi:PAS domain S-box-containing protein